MNVDATDAEWAASLTGCVRNDHFVENLPAEYRVDFCETHDEDGNPAWDQCRWVRVAEALAQARAKGEAKGLRDAAARLDGEAHRLPVLADFAAKFRDRADRLDTHNGPALEAGPLAGAGTNPLLTPSTGDVDKNSARADPHWKNRAAT